MTRGLAFVTGAIPGRAPEYGVFFNRLRWRRAARPHRVAIWETASRADEAVAGADSWVAVLESSCLPAPGTVPDAAPGRVLLSQTAAPAPPRFVHTLRELEGAVLAPVEDPAPGAAAIAFRLQDFPPRDAETAGAYVARLCAAGEAVVDAGFRAIRFPDPAEAERPELTSRLPRGAARILDVGCGAGGSIGSARDRNPGWSVTGIERDPALALRARGRCDRVLEGDLSEILPRLSAEGERFDAVVFADVLEHLDDPIGALVAGRSAASPGAVLVASVPNVGHLSIVRDLVAGRFDPVPAGLCDAGHLRWFTRRSLSDALEEAGWTVESIAAEAGAPAPDPEAFSGMAAQWPGADPESLRTYQWVAVCRAP